MNDLVFIDEAGFNLHIIRNFGRAPDAGVPFRGFPTTVAPITLCSLLSTGWGYRPPISNRGALTETLSQFLQAMLFPATNERRCTIVMDNVPFPQDAYGEESVRLTLAIIFFTFLLTVRISTPLNQCSVL